MKTIQASSISARGALVSLNLSLLLHQAACYQFYHMPEDIDKLFLVVALILSLSAALFNISPSTKIDSSQALALLLILYIVLSAVIHQNTLAELYFASIDFIVFALSIPLFKCLNSRDEAFIQKLQLMVFVISIAMYLFAKVNSTFSTSDEHTSTMYPFLLLPFILAQNSKWVRRLALVAVMLVALLEAARTTFALTVFFFICDQLQTYDKKQMLRSTFIIFLCTLLFSIAIIFLYLFAQNFTNINIIEKTLQYGDSFRSEIYSETMGYALNRDFFAQLFGTGFLSTTTANSRSYAAHNDFIETYFDYGIVGLAFLVALLCSVTIGIKGKLIKNTIPIASIITVIALCMTNMVFFNFGPISFVLMFWAYCITRSPKNKLKPSYGRSNTSRHLRE